MSFKKLGRLTLASVALTFVVGGTGLAAPIQEKTETQTAGQSDDTLTLDLNDPELKAKLQAALQMLEKQQAEQAAAPAAQKPAVQKSAEQANQEAMVKKAPQGLSQDQMMLQQKIAEQKAAEKEKAAKTLMAEKAKAMAMKTQEKAKTPGFQTPSTQNKTDEPKVSFSFVDEDWERVIKWIAKEGDFSLQPIAEPPEDLFNYSDDREHTITDAIDIINHALNVRGYTLVRNGKMLILISENDGLPDELIETISPGSLKSRGRYETLKCQFDIAGFKDLDLLRDQVSQMIGREHEEFFKFLPSAGHMIVREQGANLRLIDQILIDTRQAELATQLDYTTYQLKHVDAESLLVPVRQFMGMDADSNESRDGTMVISVEPLGERMFIKATKESLQTFERVALMVDTPVDMTETGNIEKSFMKAYPVTGDHDLAFQILQTMLEGRDDIRLGQDQTTGTIIFQGRKSDHQIVAEALAIQNITDDFVTIDLKNAEAVDVHAKLQMMFRQEPNDDGTPSTTGPIILADTYKEQIIARGTPQEISKIQSMVQMFDKEDELLALRPRARTRYLDITPDDADEVISLLNDGAFGTTGRENSLNIVLPKDRDSFKNNSIRSNFRNAPEGFDSSSRMSNELPPELEMLVPHQMPTPNPTVLPGENEKGAMEKEGMKKKAEMMKDEMKKKTSFIIPVSRMKQQFTLCAAPIQQEGNAQTTDENSQTQENPNEFDDIYRGPDKFRSVPGAPIQVKMTATGRLILISDDLDALDDMEDLIADIIGETSSAPGKPTFFFLKYAKAEGTLSALEEIFGLSGGGGGGGGGVGGVLGGVVGNMLGGATGDAVGGLLGGGGLGGDTGSDFEFEGEVRLGAYKRYNAVYAIGATGRDLDVINDMIKLLDNKDGPIQPEIVGGNWSIQIAHRDPIELKGVIEKQLSAILEQEQPAGGGGQANAQQQAQQQIARTLQQLGRGGQRGGGGAAAAKEQPDPKGRLGVDQVTRSLLVTGPEFVYLEVLKLVDMLDKPSLSDPSSAVTIDLRGKLTQQDIFRNLGAIFPDEKMLFTGEQAEAMNAPATTNPAGAARRGTTPTAAQTQAASEARINQIRNLFGGGGNARGGGGGGRGGGGGGRGGGGGGGGRGGGGRGGR